MGDKHLTDKLHEELYLSMICGRDVKTSNDITEISIGRTMNISRVFVIYIVKFKKKPSNAKFA